MLQTLPLPVENGAGADALRAAADYLRAVTDSMGDGLCTLDEDGRIVLLNPRAQELLGWTTEDLRGQNAHEVLHHTHADGSPHDAADCPLVAARLLRGAAQIDDDVLVRRDGRLLPVRLVMTPFQTEDGVGGFVLILADISARKRKDRDAARRARDMLWIERIRHALDHDRLVLRAQPIVEIGTGRTVQHELLIRMLDVDGEDVPPAMVLPVAEEHGLIGEIDRWVIRQGVGLAAAGHPVELNVSAHSLDDPSFSDYVGEALERSGADPALRVFELTETALLRDEEAALHFVAAVSGRGCRLALDDFGTGYGGFSYLKRLPVDYLKIDIEFVRDVTSEPASRKLVEAVVSLAHDFGIQTVAEGVEDARTLAVLKEYGVDFAQGYGLGRPAPLEQTIYAKGQAHAHVR
jgi:PAS domain S-box-containing protein